MVTVSLYDRTTVPTYKSLNYYGGTTYTGSNTSTYTQVNVTSDDIILEANETVFITTYVRNHRNNQNYITSYLDVRNGAGTSIYSHSGYHNGNSTSYKQYKNETGAQETITFWMKESATGTSYGEFKINRVLILTAAQLAEWEEVTLPTTRHRKYAVDKYYMLSKFGSGSFNIDGFATSTTDGGIVEVDVETIVTSTELTGGGYHLFQVTGKGFSATN